MFLPYFQRGLFLLIYSHPETLQSRDPRHIQRVSPQIAAVRIGDAPRGGGEGRGDPRRSWCHHVAWLRGVVHRPTPAALCCVCQCLGVSEGDSPVLAVLGDSYYVLRVQRHNTSLSRISCSSLPAWLLDQFGDITHGCDPALSQNDSTLPLPLVRSRSLAVLLKSLKQETRHFLFPPPAPESVVSPQTGVFLQRQLGTH